MLLDNSANDWVGLACSFVLQRDLASSRSVVPIFARDESAAYLSGAFETLVMNIEGPPGQLTLSAIAFRQDTQRGVPVVDQPVDLSGNLINSLDALAHRLDPQGAQPFSTHNGSALKYFVQGAMAATPQARAELLRSAIEEDPRFGLAYIALAETVGPTALAGVHPEMFSALDSARWTALAARLKQAPPEQQIQAQLAVLRLAPNDVDALANLGALRFLTGNRKEGERHLRRAVELNPGNFALQVQLQRFLQSKQQAH